MTLISDLRIKLKERASKDWEVGCKYILTLISSNHLLENRLLLLKSQYEKLEHDRSMGIISNSDFSVGTNKCQLGIFELIDSLTILDFENFQEAINVIIYGEDLPNNDFKTLSEKTEWDIPQAMITDYKKGVFNNK